jgi:hypothetical protein
LETAVGKTFEIYLVARRGIPYGFATVSRLRSSINSTNATTAIVLLSLLTAIGLSSAKAETCELGPFVFGEDVWQQSTSDFYSQYRKYRFSWNGSKTVARFQSKRFPVTAYGKRLAGVRVQFKDKRINRIDVLAYDEAVDGKISKEDFEKLFDQIHDTIGVHSGRGNPGINVYETATGTRREMWVNDYTAFFLEYRNQSVRPQYARQFRGDFIRLRTAPREEAASLRDDPKLFANVAKARELRQNVSNVRSTLLIKNVPMVVQGDSSSSEATTTERLFRYLRIPIDQREIAATMSAETTKSGPFYPLRAALNTLAPASVFRRVSVREFDWNAWRRIVSDYNWREKATGKPAIDGEIGLDDPSEALREMDLESLKKALKRVEPISRFRRSIVQNVSRGIPILWGVQLGIVEEADIPLSFFTEETVEEFPARNTSRRRQRVAVRRPAHWTGKHLRLIIGYDARANEVIFTDPWGESHAQKRMAIDDAHASTLSLYTVQPKF